MIKGKKTGLRAIERSDLSILRDYRNNPEFRKNFREVGELNMIRQEEWLEKVTQSPNDFMFSIVDLNKNTLIGACGLLYINWVIRSADFSFYIGYNDEYLKRDGYGGDAARVLVEYGFNTLNLNKIWMELYEFDEEKLSFFIEEFNFKKDGRLRNNCFYNGKYYDSFVISLLSDEHKKL